MRAFTDSVDIVLSGTAAGDQRADTGVLGQPCVNMRPHCFHEVSAYGLRRWWHNKYNVARDSETLREGEFAHRIFEAGRYGFCQAGPTRPGWSIATRQQRNRPKSAESDVYRPVPAGRGRVRHALVAT